MSHVTQPKPYWSPYVAGVALGLTLLATYYFMGSGLGASGACSRIAASIAHAVAPATIEHNSYFAKYFHADQPVLKDWLVFEVLGVLVGGIIGALTANRFRPQVERGSHSSRNMRLVMALAGGIIVGFASRLAQGCTSGQALSGGATLALGSWAFMFSVFGGAYAAAYFVRKEWN